MYADLIDVQMSTEGGDLLCVLVAECEREKLASASPFSSSHAHLCTAGRERAHGGEPEDQSISLSILAAPPTLLLAEWAYLREQFYL